MTMPTSWNAPELVKRACLEPAELERAFKRARSSCEEAALAAGDLRRKADRDGREPVQAAKRRCCQACKPHVEEAVEEAVAATVDDLCGNPHLADAEFVKRQVEQGKDELQEQVIPAMVEKSRKKVEAALKWAQLRGDECLGWQLMAEEEASLRLGERADWQALLLQREGALERLATVNAALQLDNVRLRRENAWQSLEAYR